MIFSYNWLQDYLKERLPQPQKLAELLTMHSFEIEEIKKAGSDWILDIDVLPNRACDCFSHLGIAREITAITNLKYRKVVPLLREDEKLKAKDFVKVEVKNKIACPRYTARVVTDVKTGPSPKWIQERLKVCGLRPISNVVDIANYVMLETGQPLHAFDREKLEGRKIIVRFAKKGEKIVTLDEEKYDLDEDVLVIADAKKPIAIAGIKGGKGPEIDKRTKTIVVESANFGPRVIRRASKKIGLVTDASLRFEHGISPNLTEEAINRAAYLIKEVSGGKVTRGLIDFYPKKNLPKRIKLDFDYIERLLGTEISKNKVKDILKRLEFRIIDIKPQSILVEVPTFRLDINIPEDLIEEIGRIYGYQKIKAVFPLASLILPRRNLDVFWEDISKNILKEAGFSEVYNYSFVSEKDINLYLANQYKPPHQNFGGGDKSAVIEVENPISIEQKYLRPSLIPNLLKNIQRNQKNFEEIKIFELGKIFYPLKTEKRMLTGLIAGKNSEFFQAKGAVDLLLRKLGISNIWYDSWQSIPTESKISIWHPKKCAAIKIDHQKIGFLGEISPKVLDKFKIDRKIIIFDIDFEKLSKLSSEEVIYQPISRFPAAVRDISVLAPRKTKVVEVLNKINIAGGSLVRDVDLFDIYEGEELPEGKKNLAFHIIYQSEVRTLKSEEIDKIHQKIIKALGKELKWQVRK